MSKKQIFILLTSLQLVATLYYSVTVFHLTDVGTIMPLAIIFAVPASFCLYAGTIRFSVNQGKGKILFGIAAIGLGIAAKFLGWPDPWSVNAAAGALIAACGWWLSTGKNGVTSVT